MKEDSTVVTDLNSLRGNPVKEVMRWEENEWEMFSQPGPDVDQNLVRVASLGLMISIDETLADSVHLEVGKGMWREEKESKWHSWE